MNLNQTLEPLPELETGLSARDEALVLGFILIIGLTFVVPVLSVVLGVPALVFVVFAGLIYAAVALLLRQVLAGSLIGFIVTAGFAANVPLAATGYFSPIPGALGPDLWLAQLPLLLSLFLILIAGPRKLTHEVTVAEILLAAFVGWSVLAALFGATARTDVALYFSLLMAQILVAVGLFRYAVQHRILRFRTVVQLFVGAVVAQSLFAFGQFINGGTFGVSTLGESGDRTLSTFSLGPLGTVSTGTYISGFTGGQFILASLIVLAVPILLATAIRSKGWRRAASLAGTLLMIAVLRATAGDAARGGLLVAGVLFVLATGYVYRAVLRERVQQVLGAGVAADSVRFGRNILLAGVMSLFSLVVVLYPSSASGASSVVTDVEDEEESTASATDSTQSETTTAETTTGEGMGETTAPQMSQVESLLRDLSIPYFDLSNLGVRFQQYIAGLDLFVQYPLFGIGGGNFRYYATEYGLPRPMPIHNIYIAVLAETGLSGFVLYMGALALTLWYGVKIAAANSRRRLLVLGVLCGLVGFLAYGFFDYLQIIKPTAVFPFGVLVGAVLGQYRTES